jgi:hypothetical protein
VQAGGEIDLRPFGETNLWLEIEMESTLAGRARQFLYQPAEIRLAVHGAAAECKSFRAPAPMLMGGFVASPLILNNQDFQEFRSGTRAKRPTGYAVELAPGTSRYWEGPVRFRISRIDSSGERTLAWGAAASLGPGI